jgi:dTDP-4-amino-4,6-dideoxygalactose transaminase
LAALTERFIFLQERPQLMPTTTELPKLAFPFLDLKAQYATIRSEIDAAVQRVMESQHFILGPEVTALEKEVAAYVGAEFGISCASGSDALLLPLMALGVGLGDEVITTPFTFVATAGSIARLGAKPVFVDIDPATYNIDAEKLTAAVTPRTRAIMPVHLFGMAADMKRISAAAGSIPVIEDAAQAIGATYGGRRVGTLGLCAGFSFFPSKNLGGAGDGGLITTNDRDFADKLYVLRTHGSRTKYDYELIGMNSRLDALQAAVLRVKLPHLDSWTAARQRNAARYNQWFREAGLEGTLTLPTVSEDCNHIYNQYVIRAPKRDVLKDHLRQRGIPSDVYYPSPLHLEPAFAYLGHQQGDFPESERASREVLALPVYPELSESQQRMVVEAVAGFYRG